MRQRVTFFLVVLVLIFSGGVFGQPKNLVDTIVLPITIYTNPLKGCINLPAATQSSNIKIKARNASKLLYPYKEVQTAGLLKKQGLAPGTKQTIHSPLHYKCNWERVQYVKILDSLQYNLLAQPVLPNSYTRNLGFFCQKELKLDKITPLPIRFRLGSLDYVNWMEQKPNAVKPIR